MTDAMTLRAASSIRSTGIAFRPHTPELDADARFCATTLMFAVDTARYALIRRAIAARTFLMRRAPYACCMRLDIRRRHFNHCSMPAHPFRVTMLFFFLDTIATVMPPFDYDTPTR